MSDSIKYIKEINTDKVFVALRDDGIGYLYFKDNTELNIELQLELLNMYNSLKDKELLPFLIEAGDGFTSTKEARDNAVSLEDRSAIKASAVVVNNLAYKIIANFYLNFNKPKRPYKVFSKREDAVKWLLQYV